jgi:hypothetical protein
MPDMHPESDLWLTAVASEVTLADQEANQYSEFVLGCHLAVPSSYSPANVLVVSPYGIT